MASGQAGTSDRVAGMISRKELRTLLHAKVLRKGGVTPAYVMPSDEGIGLLADAIAEAKRMVELSRGRWRELDAGRAKLTDAMRMIDEAAATIRECLSGSRVGFMEDLAALYRLEDAAARVRRRPYLVTPFQPDWPTAPDWHAYVGPLAGAFATAMGTTASNRPVVLSPKGALARFLANVIPLISDENPDAATVGQYLPKIIELVYPESAIDPHVQVRLVNR